MSQPEYEAIVNEIRSARIPASPELRARVRALEAAVPPAPPRRELPWRRLSLVLVPACVVVGAAAALTVGLATSGKKGSAVAEGGAFTAARPTETLAPAFQAQSDSARAHKSAGKSGAGLPTTPGRAQIYEAQLTLKVNDLSTTTKRALRLTGSFGGYVRSVEYGSGTERGTAYLVLRVPIGSVQEAIVRFSGLGTILDQHVSIQDVQQQLDKRFRQMQSLRDTIAKLQAQLENPNLSSTDRAKLVAELVAARRQLDVLKVAQTRQQRQVSYATVSVDLRTKAKAAVVPHEAGRIGRALHRSGSILLDELKVVLYVLIVGAPLLALAALGMGAARISRRRVEARLLSGR